MLFRSIAGGEMSQVENFQIQGRSHSRLNRSVRHEAIPWKLGQVTSPALRFGKYLVNRKVLRRIGEKRLVGPASEQAIQLAGIDFTGDQNVLT